MAFLDTDYRYVIVNDSYERFSGVAREQFIGRTVAEYLGEEVFRRQLKPLLDRCLQGETINYQSEFDYPALGARCVDVSYFPFRGDNGDIAGIVVTTRDITERRQSDMRLRQQAMILDQISDAVTVTDLEGNITYVNQASAAKLGRSREELIGRHVGIFGHDPSYGASQDQIVGMTLAHGRWQGEVVNFTPDGRRILMDCRINTLFDEQGRKIGMCGISTDITEKRRTENLLQARLRLSEEAASLSMEAFMQLALDEAEKLTGSRIGFFHFLEADQRTISLQAWSTATARDFCRAEGRGLHYGLEEAGLWADAIRQRQPLIHEDVPNLPGLRKFPGGHAAVECELVVPVLRGGQITAVLGVGNKPQPYDRRDVELVTSLADMVWDILQRKRVEEALKASEERFRGIYEVSPAGIAMADSGTLRFLRANRSFLEIVGYTEEELLQKQVGELTHPDDWADEQRQIAERQNRCSGEQYSVEKRYIRKDGGIRWVRLMADFLQPAGSNPLLIANVVDITDCREAEAALIASEQKYRDLFETNKDSITIFRIGADGMPTSFLAANTAAAQSVGYSVDELLRMTPMDFEPDAGAKTREERLAVIDRDGYARFETVIVDRGGRRIPVEVDVRPIIYEGEPALMNIAADITARKEAEAALQRSLAEKEVLLREVHHRVKNNMAAIIGLFELQRQSLDDPTARTVLAELSSRVRAMSLVHEKLYRSDSLSRIDFQEYIQSIVSHLRTSFGSPGIVCEIDARGIGIPLDLAVPCGMIVNELVTNALKYAFPGNGDMHAGKEERIVVRLGRIDDGLVLTVADNGVGLPSGFDWRTARSLGMVLVRTLGEHQLRGRYVVTGDEGVSFSLTFAIRQREADHG